MPRIARSLLFTATLLAAPVSHAIVVNGDLADWGLGNSGNANDWIPNSALDIQYTVEDQTGNAGVRLFPGWGGQAYDAEALYVHLDSTHLFLALVTGLAPDTPDNPAANSYGPGDFALDFGRNGVFEIGIETTGAKAGSVYSVSQWAYGLWDVNGNQTNDPNKVDKAHPTSILNGSLLGTGSLIYTSSWITNLGAYKNERHYVIEAAIPLNILAGFSGEFDVHWTMNCANDAISVASYLPPPTPGDTPVSSPSTLALLPLGLVGLMSLRRRKAG